MTHLKDHSLKAAGWAYIVGDAALVAAGIAEKDYKTAAAGALYGMGGVVLARYGNPQAEKRLQLLYQDVGQYLKSQGAEIPKGSKIDAAMLAKDNGVIEHIERFLYKHPSQVLNALFAVGGVQLLRGGMSHHRPWKTASGALVTAGALAGLLIPERPWHVESTERPHGFLDKASKWVQDKPLRVSGALYMANNATLAVDTFFDTKQKGKGSMFQLVTVASYVIANGLLATSLKNNTASKSKDSNHQALDELEQAAAEVIAAQPVETQKMLMQEMAGYLSAHFGESVKPAELAEKMQQVVEQHAQYVKAEKTSDKPENWNERMVAATATSQPSPAL